MSVDGQGDRGPAWILLYSGRKFWPLEPRPEDFSIEDVAHALSLVNRYGGHTRQPISVAEHGVRASYLVPQGLELDALLHDGEEAYPPGDILRPMKQSEHPGIAALVEWQVRVRIAFADAFGVQPIPSQYTSVADDRLLATEMRDLCAPLPEDSWLRSPGGPVAYGEPIRHVSAIVAEIAFLRRYGELTGDDVEAYIAQAKRHYYVATHGWSPRSHGSAFDRLVFDCETEIIAERPTHG